MTEFSGSATRRNRLFFLFEKGFSDSGNDENKFIFF